MKRLCHTFLLFMAIFTLQTTLFSCNDGETYAEMKNKEKNAINKFLKDNELVGNIKVISEDTFYEQDSTTNVEENEFVLFRETGIYMQIVRKGEGAKLKDMAEEQSDKTISKVLLCRFMEYDVENEDTTYTNYFSPTIVDKMLCTYKKDGLSYSASFTDGYMKAYYGSNVPPGWLKPLEFINLTRYAGKQAKVRMIVPHTSGTTNASNYVLPYYYEIFYELGK